MADKSPESNSLRSVLNPTNRTEPRPSEDESGLPSLKEGEYQPHARPANKPVYAIHFVTPGGDMRSFQYVHLDSNSQFTAERITLVFMGMQPVRVVIEGRNLWRLYDYIHQHRMPWVMVAGRDFAKDGQAIVTRVTFSTVKAETDE
jgi:hypothetical protein